MALPPDKRRTAAPAGFDKVLAGSGDLDVFGDELDRLGDALTRRVNVEPDRADHGLAQLVLTVVELLRQLMERQALRRIQGGTLTAAETEQLGQAFMKLEQRMDDLKREFELEDEDLNLNLGPLGDLL